MRLKPRPFMALRGSDRDQNVHAFITYHAAQYRSHSFQHLVIYSFVKVKSAKCLETKSCSCMVHNAMSRSLATESESQSITYQLRKRN